MHFINTIKSLLHCGHSKGTVTLIIKCIKIEQSAFNIKAGLPPDACIQLSSNKCAIEIVSLSIITAFDGNSKDLKKICILSTQFRACYIV
jgi:hypothetical protein